MEETIQEIKRVMRRRKTLLIITPILFIALSLGALQFVEPKYESSTTILVQQDGAMNPLMLYQMNMDMEEQDTEFDLQSFENFVTSRSTLERLIEELDLNSEDVEASGNKSIVAGLRDKISVSSGSSDSFELSFTDTDPERAKQAVEFLSNYYIETKQKLDRQRAEESVEYFTNKLNELEEVLNQQRSELVSSTSANIKDQPANSEALRSRLQDINSQLETIDWQIYEEEDKETYLQQFLNQSEDEFSIQPLYRLPLEEMPHGSELSNLLDRYDELDQQYTESYPELSRLRTRITEVVNRIPPALESRKNRLQSQRQDLNQQRQEVIESMEQTYIAEQQSSSQQSSYAVYQELYNEMKVNLEQAQLTSEISERAAGSFTVLDTPKVPEEPSSPNKTLILAASLFLGFIMGGFMVVIAEVLDNTVRTEKDFQIDKPIIAYLSDGRN